MAILRCCFLQKKALHLQVIHKRVEPEGVLVVLRELPELLQIARHVLRLEELAEIKRKAEALEDHLPLFVAEALQAREHLHLLSPTVTLQWSPF